MDEAPISESLESPDDLGVNNEGLARRWKLELKLADKRDRDWVEEARAAYETYAPKNAKRNSFNILWTNTETLRHAVYNSVPAPQCKRRYSDEDPLGMKVGTVLSRALEYTLDCTNFDTSAKQVVLSMLLPGRGVLWERYVPDIQSEQDGEDITEQVTWEKSVSEFVQHTDFRILCAAKTWDEVTAIGRRHRLNRKDLIEKFGEDVGNRIKLDDASDEDIKASKQDDIFKTAEIWEIWDKESKTVLFISSGLSVPCDVKKDPLGLENFFPTPYPLYAIENNQTLTPLPLYSQYKQQAMELNRISNRINNLIDALRVRGIYDATLTELSQLMKAGDDQFIPAQGVRNLIERGGIEKAIWMMPIDMAAAVLKELYVQRDATKQVIYEITGISDIMRAATDPKETFGAQKIKTQWGTQRLQRLQQEVQRYLRDVIRIKAEIISNKFSPETLESMTLVKLPHRQEVQQQQQMALMQYQQAAQQAMMQQQPPPPQPQLPPPPITWEDVTDVLQNTADRSYRIDIETDSTLAATQDGDMAGLRDVLTGVTEVIQGFGPAVQSGAVPIEVVKSIIGVVLRRARMGSAVEEAIEKIVPPKPQQDPNAIKAQAAQQQQMMKQQHDQQVEQMKLQSQAQLEQLKAQVAQSKEQAQAQGDAAKEQYRMQADMQVEQQRAQMSIATEEARLRSEYLVAEAERNHKVQLMQMEQEKEHIINDRNLEFEQWKTEFEGSTKILIAQIAAQTASNEAAASAQISADSKLANDLANDVGTQKDQKLEALQDMHGQTLAAITGVMTQLAKPKKIVRDKEGKAQGIE